MAIAKIRGTIDGDNVDDDVGDYRSQPRSALIEQVRRNYMQIPRPKKTKKEIGGNTMHLTPAQKKRLLMNGLNPSVFSGSSIRWRDHFDLMHRMCKSNIDVLRALSGLPQGSKEQCIAQFVIRKCCGDQPPPKF